MTSWATDALDRLLSMTTLFENDEDRLAINVSGTHYEINVSDLINFPDTLLGDPFKRARYLVPATGDYFFPRHSSSFESILYYYISDGVLIKAETVPALLFYDEIRFYHLNNKLIQAFYNDYLSLNETNKIESRSVRKILAHHRSIDYLKSLIDVLSAVFNALAIYSLCLETTNIYRNIHHTIWMIAHPSKPSNFTQGFQCSDMHLRPYKFIPYFDSDNITLETVCITWFYIELLIRTLTAPSMIVLMHDPNFTLDILSISPTFLSHICYRFYISGKIHSEKETRLFDYFTCLKLFRLLRLTRHAKSLEILIKTLVLNLKGILMLITLMIFGTFYFGLTQFVIEQMVQNNEIKNIAEALWHGFTVITTIGYSDIAEHHFLSYVFAIVGVWYGSISMAIILPNLTQSFEIFYNLKYRRYIFLNKK